MLLSDGVGALPKILEAYMGEALLSPNSPKAERHDLHGHWPNVGE
jgi:hypothetical protein